MSINALKSILEEIEEVEAAGDAIEAAWEQDPTNEDIEAAFDKNCEEAFMLYEEFTQELAKVTMGIIDKKTARRMLTIKREELQKLINNEASKLKIYR